MKAWDRDNAIATFVRYRRKEAKYTQIELADLTGIGLRFLRELEQGKPNVMTDKVNQLLQFFGHTLTPTPIKNETRSNLDK
ncbi:transcriptional regulator [Bizionia argentinensis JUB59]|uniref:Transcriptional regulator n=1 Tax=Bizionia argentinensis JUB59 TaxID=1046627 RepID=G2ED88_9FLAO|nr:helix-turn-helix domain-containing protein [Bizionia argentinensis]EGV43597.1 transcriptional regulator [Bizionia argentinensis JUB59]